MVAWNGKELATRPGGNRSKAESKNIAVGLGDGLSVTLCGGESTVDPSIRSVQNEESTGNIGPDVGRATSIGGWTAVAG